MREIKEVWAVVCGSIRDELEVKMILNELLIMRAEGEISGIVISTWLNEVDRFLGLRKELEEANIRLIEQKPFDSIVHNMSSTSENYFRQSYQFQKALDVLPDGCFVLKTRTDRAFAHLKKIRSILSNKKFYEELRIKDEEFENLPRIFNYKLMILGAKTQRIFNFSDFVFMGAIEDVQKLVNFDVADLYLGRDLVANTQWFIYPFFKEFPVLRDYFRLINFRPLIKGMKEAITNQTNLSILPLFFCRIYALYIHILTHYFTIIPFKNGREISLTQEYNFLDLFSDNKPLGLDYTELGTVIESNHVLENLMNVQKFSKNQQNELFIKQLQSAHLGRKITQLEYSELVDFQNNNNWFSFSNWLRTKNWEAIVCNQDEKKHIFSYNFSELTVSENKHLLDTLKNSEVTAPLLFRYWMDHEKLGVSAALQMVFPLARTRNQDAILILSRLRRLKKMENKVDRDSLDTLVLATYGVRRQRGTTNIITCQLMLDYLLADVNTNTFIELYNNVFFCQILTTYLEKKEMDYVLESKLPQDSLVDYLYTLSEKYKKNGSEIRSLRLIELSGELSLTKESIKKISGRYKEINNKFREELNNRTLCFFEK